MPSARHSAVMVVPARAARSSICWKLGSWIIRPGRIQH
jgi:hypothetical protein